MTTTIDAPPLKKAKTEGMPPGSEVDRRVTSPLITQDLKARGVAKVLVVLNAPEAFSATKQTKQMALSARAAIPADLAANFVASELSHDGAIAANAGAKAAPRLALTAAKRRALPPFRYYENLGVILGNVTAEGLDRLQTDRRVASVSGAPPMKLIRPHHRLSLSGSVASWGLDALNVSKVWEHGVTGEGIVVGHLDTGVDGSHPYLKGAIAKFADFDNLGEDRHTAAPYDSGDHGTHTAGIIAGRRSSSRSGVAPDCQLASAVVIEGGDSLARVTSALNWLLTTGARIVNLSFGFPGWWEDVVPLINIIRNRGILPIAAIGNEGPGTSRSPGNYIQVLSLGAVDKDRAMWSESSSQQFQRSTKPNVPDVVAPGVDIVSAKPGGGYQSMDGTSMAAPHIAGLSALLLSAKPGATIDQLEEAILKSCTRPPGIAAERGGAGIPDAYKALQILAGPLTLAARISRPIASRRRKPRAGKRIASRRPSVSRSKKRISKKSPAVARKRKSKA